MYLYGFLTLTPWRGRFLDRGGDTSIDQLTEPIPRPDRIIT